MKYQTIGTIINTHGLNGEVKVKVNSLAKHNQIFVPNAIVYVLQGNDYRKLVIQAVRSQPPFLLVKFEGYQTIEQVTFMKQKPLMIAHEDAKQLNQGAEIFTNLIDYQVVDQENGKVIGTIISFFDNNHHGLWVIKTVDHQTLFLPNHHFFIKMIDEAKQIVQINLIEGLVINENV